MSTARETIVVDLLPEQIAAIAELAAALGVSFNAVLGELVTYGLAHASDVYGVTLAEGVV